MKKIMMVLTLTVIALTGCGGRYELSTIAPAGSTNPDALRVFVAQYEFADAPGHAGQIGRYAGAGEISPFLKEAIVSELKNVNFVDEKDAQLKIITKNVQFNRAAEGLKAVIITEINGHVIKSTGYAHRDGIFDVGKFTDYQYANALKIASHLIAQHMLDTQIPAQVSATFKRNVQIVTGGDLYDVE